MGYGADAEVVQAAREGRTDALAEIYDRYGDRIYGFCLSLTRDTERAADATQDTFVRAVQSLGQLRDPSRLRSWLFAIARNQVMGSARSEGRMVPSGDPLEVEEIGEEHAGGSTGVDPVGQVIADDMVRLVWDAAAGLDERDRLLLELNLRQGLEGAELAEAMGVDPGHGYVLLSRMKQRVERSLGALLVARLGRDDCEDLAALLSDWDGRFSVRLRKRVARHVDSCTTCNRSRSSLVAPAALFASVPFIPSPVELRDRILGQMVLASANTPIGPSAATSAGDRRQPDRRSPNRSRPGPSRPPVGPWGGTVDPQRLPPPPPPSPPDPERNRRRRGLWLSAAALVVILLGGLAVSTQRPRKGVVLASDRPTTTAAPSTSSATGTTAAPPTAAATVTSGSSSSTSVPTSVENLASSTEPPGPSVAGVGSTDTEAPSETSRPGSSTTQTTPSTVPTTVTAPSTSTTEATTTVPTTSSSSTTSVAPTTAEPTTSTNPGTSTSSSTTSTSSSSTTTSTSSTSTTREPPGPQLRVSPSTVTLASAVGQFTIVNVGPGSVDWSISSAEPTLIFSASSGSLAEGASVIVTVYGPSLNGPTNVTVLGGVQPVSLTVSPEPPATTTTTTTTTTTGLILLPPPTIGIPTTTLVFTAPTLGSPGGP